MCVGGRKYLITRRQAGSREERDNFSARKFQLIKCARRSRQPLELLSFGRAEQETGGGGEIPSVEPQKYPITINKAKKMEIIFVTY